MRAFSIAWKDVRHVYRNIAALATMLVAPLLLSAALGAAFGSGDNFNIAAVRTVVVNLDKTVTGAGAHGSSSPPAIDGTVSTESAQPAVGGLIVSALKGAEQAKLLAITQMATPEAARLAVDEGDADVAVIIPPGLSDGLTGSGVESAPGAAQVQIYKDPALSIGPGIVAAVVRSVVQTINGARASAQAAVQLAGSDGITDPEVLDNLAASTAQSFSLAYISAAPVLLDRRAPVAEGADVRETPNVASQVLVGMMIFFMLFGASTAARNILDEHRQGTLARLFTTSTPRSVILAGKYIAVFLVVLGQSTILLLAGMLLLGARWGEIGPVIVLALCGALVASSLGLVTVSFAKTPGQAGAVSAAIFVFLGLIGGNFVGSTNIGGTFAVVRRFTPNGWLIEGWSHVLYGGSWKTILLPVAVVLTFTMAFFALATLFFRRRYA